MSDELAKQIINEPSVSNGRLKIYINNATRKPYVSLGECLIPQLKGENDIEHVRGIVIKDMQSHENFAFTKKFINDRFTEASIVQFG